MSDSTTNNSQLLWQATEFAWQEADLLDAKRYDEWLDLWSADGHYVMPLDPNTEDFANSLNLCFDDTRMLRARIERLRSGFSISAAPPAETIRTVSRLALKTASDTEIVVTGAQHLIEDKFGRKRTWAGNVEYTLELSGNGFSMKRKVIRLINSNGVLNAFSYLF